MLETGSVVADSTLGAPKVAVQIQRLRSTKMSVESLNIPTTSSTAGTIASRVGSDMGFTALADGVSSAPGHK